MISQLRQRPGSPHDSSHHNSFNFSLSVKEVHSKSDKSARASPKSIAINLDMPQRELDRAVARATGENVSEIRRRGFSLADPDVVDYDPEPYDLPPQVVDWDEVDLLRNVALIAQ